MLAYQEFAAQFVQEDWPSAALYFPALQDVQVSVLEIVVQLFPNSPFAHEQFTAATRCTSG